MDLVDMKLQKDECKNTVDVAPSSERWPYGLQLRFESEQIDKMPSLKEYKVGDLVNIQAVACVTGVRMSEAQGASMDKKVNWSVELQIEQVACEPAVAKKPEEMSIKEYSKMRMARTEVEVGH